MTKNKKGFTLIELVVVMAIIAVLAALMVTAIVAARKAATNTQITGNAKTIETALETFSTKFSGSYPNTSGTTPLATAVTTGDVMTATTGLSATLQSDAAFKVLSGGPAGLKTFQIYYVGGTGSGYTLTACDSDNTAWGTVSAYSSTTNLGITAGTVNPINTQGPCATGSKVIYSTAR